MQAIFGLRTDLDLLVGNRYVMTAAIFYLGFIVGAYPAIAIAQRYPIDRVASIIVSLWGICLMCTAACTKFQGIYAQRFFLGLLESGISPMFMLIVVSWTTCSPWVTGLTLHRAVGTKRTNKLSGWGKCAKLSRDMLIVIVHGIVPLALLPSSHHSSIGDWATSMALCPLGDTCTSLRVQSQ